MHSGVRSLAVAITTGIALSIGAGWNAAFAEAVSTSAPIRVTTKDALACRDADDTPICFLRLYSREAITPLRKAPFYLGKEDLLNAIEAGGKYVRPQPDDWYEKRAHAPTIAIFDAVNMAIALDNSGGKPRDALALIKDTAPGLEAESLAAGQIQLASTAVLHITAYANIVARHFSAGDEYPTRPSRGLAEAAVAAWEAELPRLAKVENDDYERVAEAYGKFGDENGVKRLLAQTDWKPDNPYREIKAGLLLGDFDQAWRAARKNLSTEAPRFNADYVAMVFEAAEMGGDESTLDQIAADVAEFLIDGGNVRFDIRRLLRRIAVNKRADVAQAVEKRVRSAETSLDGEISDAIFAWKATGEAARADALLAEWLDKARNQPPGVCGNAQQRCPREEVEAFLAKENRLIEAKEWTELGASQQFQLELRHGQGVPSTIEVLLASDRLVVPALRNCMHEKARYSLGPKRQKNDLNAAATCADALHGYVQTDAQIDFERERFELNSRLKRGATELEIARQTIVNCCRYDAAVSLVRLAHVAKAQGDLTISDRMLALAYDLWDKAPETALDSSVLTSLRGLGEIDLKADGRL